MAQTKLRQKQMTVSPPFRNLIVDGAMQIAQAGTSESGVTTSGYKKFNDLTYLFLSSMGTWTLSQDTANAPTTEGFGYALKYDVTTEQASPAAGSYALMSWILEGQYLQNLRKGTASAQSLTLSFWIRATSTGNTVVEIEDIVNSRHICSLVTINAANTWEKKTITFSGDTTGTITNDKTAALRVNIWLGAGTNFSSGTLQTTWSSQVSANRAVGCTNWAGNTANDFYVAGIQLEVGTSATEFEHLPYDVVLHRVQRYLRVINNATGGANAYILGDGMAVGATVAKFVLNLNPPMRDVPVLAYSALGDSIVFSAGVAKTNTAMTVSAGNSSRDVATIQITSASLTTGAFTIVYANSTSAILSFDARL